MNEQSEQTLEDLVAIAAAFDTTPDPHGMVHVRTTGAGRLSMPERYVLVDRDVWFRVGLYDDREVALVMVEVPTVDDAIAAARTFSRFWIEVAP